MRFLKIIVLLCFAPALLVPASLSNTVARQASTNAVESQSATEAPTGFDNQTNGLFLQDQFDADKVSFGQREEISDGLGPVYNAQGCVECHQNPVSGGNSQVIELRAGHFDGNSFTDHSTATVSLTIRAARSFTPAPLTQTRRNR